MLTDFIKEATLILEETVNEETITERQRNDILDYTIRAGKYLFRKDVNVLMKMDEYVPSFLKFQREIVEDLQNEKKDWEAERKANKVEKENSIKNYIEAESADGITKEKCCLKIQRIFSLSEEDAKEKVDTYWMEND